MYSYYEYPNQEYWRNYWSAMYWNWMYWDYENRATYSVCISPYKTRCNNCYYPLYMNLSPQYNVAEYGISRVAEGVLGECTNDEITFDSSPKPMHHIGGKRKFAVEATYLYGAEMTRGGIDRAKADIELARELWGIDIQLGEINDFATITPDPTGSAGAVFYVGVDKEDLVCGKEFRNKENIKKILREYITSGGMTPRHRIHILYMGHDSFINGNTIGCAWTDYDIEGGKYQVIALTNRANNEFNVSTCAHELGHIFFGTVPQESNTDPTAVSEPSSHSPRADNVMNSVAGTNRVITTEQRAKAMKSRIYTIYS
ncbi:hypothetical protein [Bacillus bombysepticus]|uniref:hypothetical protein n=1 Tax=Bacillus bombysepticus TaxID=658666 RepID=UPI003017C0FD